jgi:segregation and condensation protein B
MASDEPLSLDKLLAILSREVTLSIAEIRALIEELQCDYQDRGIELKQLASGYAFQTKSAYASWVGRLWEEKPPKYSRALLETLVIIAYRQPVTRPEIENIRGVAVNPNIIKTLLERDWIRVVGHKEVPGKPALFATTSHFLDYFNLKTLAELPNLEDLPLLAELTTGEQSEQNKQNEKFPD